jgi:aryl-alcohol dehydrogenase-like predicted oxidoreductase
MERTSVSVVASAVLAGGALTGKYPGPGRLKDRLEDPEIRRAVEAAPGAPAAIRFALAHPRVASVLFGATTPAQVAENVGAL